MRQSPFGIYHNEYERGGADRKVECTLDISMEWWEELEVMVSSVSP